MRPINPASILIAGAFGIASALAAFAAEPPPRPSLAGKWQLNKELSEDPGQKMMETMRAGGGERSRGGGMGRGGGAGGGMGGGPGGGRGGGGMGGGQRGAGGPGSGGGPGGGGQGGGGMFASDEPPLDGDADVESEPRNGPPPGRRPDPSDGGATQGSDPIRRGPGMRGPKPSHEFQIDQDGDNLAFRSSANLRLLHSDGEKRQKEGAFGKQDVVTKFVKGLLVVESKGERGGKRTETYAIREDAKLQIDFEMDGSGPMPTLKFRLVYDPVAVQPNAQF